MTDLVFFYGTLMSGFKRAGRSQAFAVSSGFAEIASDRVSVLVDSAEAGTEIDAAAAEREKAEAEEEMKTAGIDTLDPIRARIDLAEARLTAARRPS